VAHFGDSLELERDDSLVALKIAADVIPINARAAPGEKVLVGVVFTAVVVEMECGELVAIFGQRELGLREASLVTAVIAEFQAFAIKLGVNIVDKMENLWFSRQMSTFARSATSISLAILSIPICEMGG
jgi:hypothetical protein